MGAAKRGVGFNCQLQLRGRNDSMKGSSAHRHVLTSVLGCAAPTIHPLMRHTAKYLMHTTTLPKQLAKGVPMAVSLTTVLCPAYP